MSHRFARLAAALAVVCVFAVPAFAAGEPTVVKVTLTDISSATNNKPSGDRMRSGMMGEGLGGGMMGGGMMGGGIGPGFGGSGQGSNGASQLVPGMMGGGMMAVRIDHTTVKAGDIRFDVTNSSQGMMHEMLVIAVDGSNALLPYDAIQGKVLENQVKVLGDTGDMQPNGSKILDLKLAPGSYLLVCNVPGHYAYGMVASLTVTP